MTETTKTHKTGHTEAEKALWLIYVMQYTAEELDMPITETAPFSAAMSPPHILHLKMFMFCTAY